MRLWNLAGALILALSLVACGSRGDEASDSMLANESDGTNWPMYGRTFSANHYSPLDQINSDNIGQLGLKWSLDLPVGNLYVSPIAVDGVIYFGMGLSVINAVDGRTGKLLWTYDPKVGDHAGPKLRAAWGTRGIAWYNGKIFTGTMDGRLIAVDARTGKEAWSVQTTQGPDDGRYITGAPWVFRGKVVIGHGGADFTPLRGYVTAYDTETGKKLWRFYTVPGNPADGGDGEASDSIMPTAAKTWTGEWWKFGGGGTVWNAMAYDPKFNRLYIGTGNGFPWNRKIRSPDGGDNLFLCSIVALDADTGKYVWHYQVNPGEQWDYNANMDIALTDMMIGGKMRPVLMQAPKSGHYYVIDRETGKLLSAEPIVKVTWASRIDIATGRPVENPEARYPTKEGAIVWPNPIGAHGVQPMSFNPKSGLTYIPTTEAAHFFSDIDVDPKTWKPMRDGVFSGMNDAGVSGTPPPHPLPEPKMALTAWNPQTQTKAWSVPLPPHSGGGVMSTAGGLVFMGGYDGYLRAYDAKTGNELWSFNAQTGINSQPITYTVDGKQYVTLLAGYRGITVEATPWGYRNQPRRVLTFAIGGKGTLPPNKLLPKQFVDDPAFKVDPAKVAQGGQLYVIRRCFACHGGMLDGGSLAPDLRESSIPLSQDAMTEVVRNGALRLNGMPEFPELSEADIEALRHYIRFTTREAKAGRAPKMRNVLTY